MAAINVSRPDIPSIETDRLVLRGHSADDFGD